MAVELNSNLLQNAEPNLHNGNLMNEGIVNKNEKFKIFEIDYRDPDDSSSSTLSISDDSDSSSSFDDSFALVDDKERPSEKVNSSAKIPNCRTKGELTLDDLPKIEELTISVPESDVKAIGKISGIVDREIIVAAFKNSSALNIDSILFLSNGKAIGRIFDVFGPVIEPFYSIRFNSAIEIQTKGFVINDIVYYAPENEDTTTYVFVDSLRKEKGSDASWSHNNEPPLECLDYSDDEQEKQAKQKARAKHRNHDVEITSEVISNKLIKNNIQNINTQSDVFNHSIKNNLTTYQMPNMSKSHFRFPFQNTTRVSSPILPNTNYNGKTPTRNYFEPFSKSSFYISRPLNQPLSQMLPNNFSNLQSLENRQQLPQKPIDVERHFYNPQSSGNFNENVNSVSNEQSFSTNNHANLQRMPSKTSAEVLSETFFHNKDVQPQLFPSSILNNYKTHPSMHHNLNFEKPISIKMERLNELDSFDHHFQRNTNLSKPYFPQPATSVSWNCRTQNSPTPYQSPLIQQGIEPKMLTQNTPLFQRNAEVPKVHAVNANVSTASSQVSVQSNLLPNMTPPITSNSFNQHATNFMRGFPTTNFMQSPAPSNFVQNPPPSNCVQSPPPSNFVRGTLPTNFIRSSPPSNFIRSSPPSNFIRSSPPSNFIRSPPPSNFVRSPMPPNFVCSPPPNFVNTSPSLLVTPQQRLNFCSPSSFIQNFNQVPVRLPSNVVPAISWQPFHLPIFGVSPTVINQKTLQTSNANIVPTVTQRPMTIQTMPNSNITTPSLTPNRVPFYDPRQPPPGIFRCP